MNAFKQIQIHKRFKRTLFIRTKHNSQIFGEIPFIKLQTTFKFLIQVAGSHSCFSNISAEYLFKRQRKNGLLQWLNSNQKSAETEMIHSCYYVVYFLIPYLYLNVFFLYFWAAWGSLVSCRLSVTGWEESLARGLTQASIVLHRLTHTGTGDSFQFRRILI